jgi:AcrR family transcriptional regulator
MVATGRPRTFDVDQALERALRLFWRRGYDGTSISDLTRAMRIERPSLYAAFGNKRALFRRALDRYADGPAAYVREALREPTARRVVEKLLRGAIDLLTDARHPRGCLLVHGALSCGKEAEPIRKGLAARRLASEADLRRRFKRAIAEGDLAADADAAGLARYVAAIMVGMSVQASDGARRRDLENIADTALRAWPS